LTSLIYSLFLNMVNMVHIFHWLLLELAISEIDGSALSLLWGEKTSAFSVLTATIWESASLPESLERASLISFSSFSFCSFSAFSLSSFFWRASAAWRAEFSRSLTIYCLYCIIMSVIPPYVCSSCSSLAFLAAIFFCSSSISMSVRDIALGACSSGSYLAAPVASL